MAISRFTFLTGGLHNALKGTLRDCHIGILRLDSFPDAQLTLKAMLFVEQLHDDKAIM